MYPLTITASSLVSASSVKIRNSVLLFINGMHDVCQAKHDVVPSRKTE